jgi:hypothetical protein
LTKHHVAQSDFPFVIDIAIDQSPLVFNPCNKRDARYNAISRIFVCTTHALGLASTTFILYTFDNPTRAKDFRVALQDAQLGEALGVDLEAGQQLEVVVVALQGREHS